VAGKIAEVNNTLIQKPETVNKDPYGNGWILKISDTNNMELGTLMNAAEYEKSLGN
jgi:glycine cleavage system H protein